VSRSSPSASSCFVGAEELCAPAGDAELATDFAVEAVSFVLSWSGYRGEKKKWQGGQEKFFDDARSSMNVMNDCRQRLAERFKGIASERIRHGGTNEYRDSDEDAKS
jgi:hypothetical protein